MKRSVVIGGLVLLFLVGVYFLLGGFAPLEMELVSCGEFKLSGIHYRGTPQDAALGESFRKIEDVIAENPGSVLHTIYEVEPAGKLDTLRVFVGTVLPEQVDSLELLAIPCKQAIIAKIRSHRFVMPSPLKVKSQIEAYAAQRGVTLSGVFIDVLHDSDEVTVWAPLVTGD
ncbi:GyrI-like domain-containing protein [Lunatimonas salinarum]|uniref:GyrI-like domain-containing protein n=1 Tax=Lunatimonas salinarum TaxID=1774590 RepID=UPI001ADF8371|nr:GyrI-like domain-containing protein [Lunatimonas salinarum]